MKSDETRVALNYPRIVRLFNGGENAYTQGHASSSLGGGLAIYLFTYLFIVYGLYNDPVSGFV